MPTTTEKGYLVRRVGQAPTVDCPCGQSTRSLTAEDTPRCNLHVVFIRDARKHYHNETTEVYYILEGKGKMELNDNGIDVEPGTVIYLEPYPRHRLYSEAGVKTLVIGMPAYRIDDEYFASE